MNGNSKNCVISFVILLNITSGDNAYSFPAKIQRN